MPWIFLHIPVNFKGQFLNRYAILTEFKASGSETTFNVLQLRGNQNQSEELLLGRVSPTLWTCIGMMNAILPTDVTLAIVLMMVLESTVSHICPNSPIGMSSGDCEGHSLWCLSFSSSLNYSLSLCALFIGVASSWKKPLHQDRNVSSEDKTDQSEEVCIDLQWLFPQRGQIEPNHANKPHAEMTVRSWTQDYILAHRDALLIWKFILHILR